jgi:hypothetical protein
MAQSLITAIATPQSRIAIALGILVIHSPLTTMEINIDCTKMSGYYNAVIELDGTNDLDNPIIADKAQPLDAIAGVVLEYLIATGQLSISINGVKIEPKPEEETPYESFFDDSDWLEDCNVI